MSIQQSEPQTQESPEEITVNNELQSLLNEIFSQTHLLLNQENNEQSNTTTKETNPTILPPSSTPHPSNSEWITNIIQAIFFILIGWLIAFFVYK
jgi:hypothetical protein